MRRTIFKLALILTLLLQSVTVALAQDNPDEPRLDHQIFMPLVTGGVAGRESALSAEGPVGPVDGTTPSALGTASVAKGEVNAANRGVDSLRPVSLIVRLEDSASADPLAAIAGVKIIHRYTKVFNGVSLLTTEGQVDQIKAAPGVAAVYLDQLMQPTTDASPAFIGAPTIWDAMGGQESGGEGVTIGVLDTGIWPEHPSLSDPDPSDKPYDPPAVAPGANGFGLGGERSTCDFGNSDYNADDAPFVCNNKLIGAYTYLDTYKAFIDLLPTEFDSARDAEGHGTHTATTAAGNAGVAASIFGRDFGLISGIAPRAHIIAYRVCADQGCFQSDSVAAIDQALLDSVDAINFSISGGGSPYGDAVELAFLAAYDNGVFVAASAGNNGPAPNTADHNGPWTMTVGASTTDRSFLSTLTVTADNGDELSLTGATVTDGIADPLPVVFASDPLCIDLGDVDYTGQIVICDRGVIARVEKSYNVAQKNGAGMILRNPAVQDVDTDNHFIPSIHIDVAAGTQLGDFMASHAGVAAAFTAGVASPGQGDVMAAFSSRGGPGQTLGIGKPDVTAPGVQILAGNTPLPATPLGGFPGQLFQSIQGTSMSSPHVAGAGALLKALHPDWSPGQIKSALMMTAKTDGVVKEDGATPANAYDYGSGRIDLNRAGDPGVTISENAENFVVHQNDLWNANYPSIYLPNFPGAITLERTVQDVSGAASVWRLSTTTDANSWVIETPEQLAVPAGGAASFAITVRAPSVPIGQSHFGQIYLTNGDRQLHIPVTFVRGQSPIVMNHICIPSVVDNGQVARCQLTLQNTAFVDADYELNIFIHDRLQVIPGSLNGGHLYDAKTIKAKGVLRAQAAPLVNATVDPTASPAGYLALGDFGGNTEVTLTDESIANFVVPSFVYAGEVYDRIGIVSNGYLIVGGGTGSDVDYVNQQLPDANAPNNVLAPFWTDLDPGSGGQVLINFLTDGTNTWMVIEYNQVPIYSDPAAVNTFQVWIGVDGAEDISFTYGPDITAGDGGYLTVGAENRYGNSGGMVYYNGDGMAPAPSYPNGDYEVDVASTPGEPGAKRTFTYRVRGVESGYARNCARLESSIFQGSGYSCGKLHVR